MVRVLPCLCLLWLVAITVAGCSARRGASSAPPAPPAQGTDQIAEAATASTATPAKTQELLSEKQVGIPFFPGATVAEATGTPYSGKRNGTLYQAQLVIRAPRDQVEAFYRKCLPGAPEPMLTLIDEKPGDLRFVQIWWDETEKCTRVVMRHNVSGGQ